RGAVCRGTIVYEVIDGAHKSPYKLKILAQSAAMTETADGVTLGSLLARQRLRPPWNRPSAVGSHQKRAARDGAQLRRHGKRGSPRSTRERGLPCSVAAGVTWPSRGSPRAASAWWRTAGGSPRSERGRRCRRCSARREP